MNFKTPVVIDEFNNAPMALQVVMCDVARFSKDTFGIEITITRILGKIEGDSGVHSDYRAFDLRDEYLGEFTYTESQSKLMSDWLNEKYKRLDGYVVCLHHSFKGGAKHFHVQLPYVLTDLRTASYRN